MTELYPLVRQFLFRFDPEWVHQFTLSLLRVCGRFPPVASLLRSLFTTPSQPVRCFGLIFPNRVGLAAGYDKDGIAWQGLSCLGFGHIEVGTVTPKPQPGNPKPRLFRLPEAQALINRMGFPGRGAAFVAQQLRCKRPAGVVLGVNLGKNQATPLERAAEDYLALFDVFAPLADYLAVNVSSPNTLGLRRLQARQALEELLSALHARRRETQTELGKHIPILVKIAPDLEDRELDDILEVVTTQAMDGIIATNTTVQRKGLQPDVLSLSPTAGEDGGLSGLPLFALSLETVKKIRRRAGERLPLIGVGGVVGREQARAMLDAGADLLQVYTGLVYRGPGLVREIAQA
ncbi:MAG: quinone-dependent dihydroorotate dehydrogenase [Anaerolineales bacterium]|nr:quinone-dependent dihydroorotate dehydrogenase [Anaerolineales bacterium]MDW8160511.1 quinone-dependent dihydroorotate dehydrogenase [Anaerolineales bacterium]